ncbi:MAG: TM2 domain-containing protein [Eubacterium sp.]|nr:TM2 domain-containing protein [Eubacterium sp.]
MDEFNNNYNPQQDNAFQNNEQPQYQQAPPQQDYQQVPPQPQYDAQQNYNQYQYQYNQQPVYGAQPADAKDKLTAGLLAIFLGVFGVHKFYLGYTTSAIIMLLVSLFTFGIGATVMGIIGIIEGIIYLTKNDAEFYNTYVVNEKQWF